MIAKHVYMKGRNGWGIFYRIEDCLVYFTIYSVLVRQMNLCVLAFSIMFNHTHSLLKSIIDGRLSRFQHRLGSIFAHEYNAEYERTGPVFKSPYGESDKRGVKNIISAIAYNANNPVAGKMCKKAADNMWTLLAYYNNPNPFSKKLVKRESRHVMRDALKIVDLYYSKGKHLGYAVLRRIYARLDIEEKRQKITELIRRLSDCQIEREASINMGNPDAGKPIRKVWLPKPEFNQWGDLTPRSAREIGSKVELLLYQEGYLQSQCKRTDMTEYYNEVVRKARELGKITAAEDGTWRYKRDG